jgi:16S rRNA (guanine966-N2)-methyltransferase
MRITGGTASGRILKVPKGLDVRPTPDLVKQALFNSLGARVAGASVLELFAGTGALSLDCLSRGAAHAMVVEKSARHARVILDNLAAAGFASEILEVRTHDAFAALSQLAAAGRKFDLVVADPPYGEKNADRRSHSLAQRLLDDVHLPQVIAADGMVILGHARRDALEIPAGWRELKVLKHGDSMMRFLSPKTPASADSTGHGEPMGGVQPAT